MLVCWDGQRPKFEPPATAYTSSQLPQPQKKLDCNAIRDQHLQRISAEFSCRCSHKPTPQAVAWLVCIVYPRSCRQTSYYSVDIVKFMGKYPYLFNLRHARCVACKQELDHADATQASNPKSLGAPHETLSVVSSMRSDEHKPHLLLCRFCRKRRQCTIYMAWCCRCSKKPSPTEVARAYWSAQGVETVDI